MGSLPVKGQTLYIGDRKRETSLRNEIMQQLNDHTRMINSVKAQYLREEEHQLTRTAENEIDR